MERTFCLLTLDPGVAESDRLAGQGAMNEHAPAFHKGDTAAIVTHLFNPRGHRIRRQSPGSRTPHIVNREFLPAARWFQRCLHLPGEDWYHQPFFAFCIQVLAKVERISDSHSGCPLALAMAR